MWRELAALVLWLVAIGTCGWKCWEHRRQIATASSRRGAAWHTFMCLFWIGWLVVITFMLSR